MHKVLSGIKVLEQGTFITGPAAGMFLADLGAEVAPGVHEAEQRHLQRTEWATTADDVLWRRSKLGLHLTPTQREAVAQWFAARLTRTQPLCEDLQA